MTHVTREELLRVSEAGKAEIARVAAHLAVCPACRSLTAGALGDRTLTARRTPPLKLMTELAGIEKAAAAGRLLAKAELSELRRLTPGAQKERVILSRFCHSPAFLDTLLGALRTARPREESESLATLASLAAQGMDPAEGSDAFKNDFLAMIWIETANARRIRGEWQHAHTALLRADEHRAAGTRDQSVRARWLSISGSLQCDQGRRDEAMTSFEECWKAYALCGEWPLVGRTLVSMAHCIADDEPERAVGLLDRALLYIPSEDAGLRSLIGRIRTDCLVTVGRLGDALRAFAEAERIRPSHDRPSAALRSTFIAARLLEALGHLPEAEVLFDAVVAEELDRGYFKDAVLDLVYILGFHVRLGAPDRAADVGHRALDELDRHNATVHEECRSVLSQLVDAARGECLDEGMLRSAREYLRAQWNRPLSAPPALAHSEERAPLSLRRPDIMPEQKLVEPLLAKALWCRLRRKPRKEQQALVARSSECHTRIFIEVLLSEVCQTNSREEAEFAASLAFQAIAPMEAPAPLKHDLQARLWTEIANVRRIAAEWSKANAALAQARKHLGDGSGDSLIKARAQSVSGSLFADQGRRVEALAALEECLELYESKGAWAFVARTLVQMAHTLVDTDPARALTLAAEALSMIPAADIVLRSLAENIRTDGMMNLGEIELALHTFDHAEPLRLGVSAAVKRRSDFIAARLLEHLGYPKEAAQLFETAIADAFDQEAYREAFLDLLYLFALHIRTGATEKAISLCRFAVAQIDLFDLGHEQLRRVWVDLLEATRRQMVTREALVEIREFLSVHWKHPAMKIPKFSFR